MVRKDGAEARKDRISQIAQTIQACLFQNKETGEVPLRKVLARIMIDTGLTKDKVLEYLQLLNDAGQFELDEKNEKIARVRV
ncbi:MAG: hypothetical protein ABSA79_02525 [Candidatus Bathyarchaeia archaeon]|jgi:hypothetical protein